MSSPTDPGDAGQGAPGGAPLLAARANFEPIGRFIEGLDGEVLPGGGAPCRIEPMSEMRAVAARTHDVAYAVRHPSGRTMVLRFTMVGGEADRVLFQVQHRSAGGDEGATGGTLDQHVYRLNEVEELKTSIRRSIAVFLAG